MRNSGSCRLSLANNMSIFFRRVQICNRYYSSLLLSVFSFKCRIRGRSLRVLHRKQRAILHTVQNPPGNFALTMNYGKQAISRELVRTDLLRGEVAGKGAQSGSVGWPQKVQPVGRQIKFSLRLHGAVAYCCFLYAKQG